MKIRALAAAAAALALAAGAAQAQQGVSKTEITLGSIQDLSGPLAGFGNRVKCDDLGLGRGFQLAHTRHAHGSSATLGTCRSG